MARSMTGFGRAELCLEERRILCTVKSINHRYLELSLRMPDALREFEPDLRALCRERLKRGKIDLQIEFKDESGESSQVYCDLSLAEGYRDALRDLAALTGDGEKLRLRDLARLPGVLRAEAAPQDRSAVLPLLNAALEKALLALNDMRQREGDRLVQDILERAGRLGELRRAIQARAPFVVEEYRERLNRRLDELLGEERERFVDEQRIAAEVLIFADKASIEEELTRLASHLKSLEEILDEDGPIGKKLDFLMQEINREINTIGSKANDLQITQTVVAMKHEAENIREQIQNLE